MQEALATAYDRLGQILEGATERKNEGLLMYRKTLKIREALAADEALNTDRLRAVAASHTAIGDVLLKIGDFSAAVHSHRTSLTILEELSAADPANVQFSGDVEAVRGRLGAALTGQGNHQAAIPLLQTSLARQEELLRIDPSSDIVRFRIATTQQELGTAECALAAERTRPASQRMQFWREGRSHLRTSLDALTAFRNRGAITGDEAAKVDQAAASFATCDVGVTGLSK
jgi:tetratricopeptide (TPR) repeat protein